MSTIVSLIHSFYTNRAYHNWSHHVARTFVRAMKLGEQTGANIEVLALSSLGHDACFGTIPAGFDSQEQYTATVIRQLLIDQGYPTTVADQVFWAIMATNVQVAPVTLEQKILRAADLGGMATDDFFGDFDRLWVEASRPSRKEFFRRSIAFLSHYLWPAIKLTPNFYDANGASAWHNHVLINIVKMHRQLFDEPVIVEVGPGGNPFVLFDYEPSLAIGIEPDTRERQSAIRLLSAARKTELVVPGSGNALPVGFAPDELRYYNVALHCPDALSVNEIARIHPREIKVIESYDPCEGFGLRTDKAVSHLAGIMRKANYTLSGRATALSLPNADHDAFRITFNPTTSC